MRKKKPGWPKDVEKQAADLRKQRAIPDHSVPEALAGLKKILQEATRFSDIGTYFFDQVFDIPEILDGCRPARDEKLEACLTEIGKRFTAVPERLTGMVSRLVELPEHQFIHGQCFAGGFLGLLIYFRDIEVGLVILNNDEPNSNTEYVRFRAVDLLEGPGVPQGRTTVHGRPMSAA